MSTLLSTNQLAKMLNREPITLAVWRAKRQGPKYLRHKGRVYYRPGDVADWLEGLQADGVDLKAFARGGRGRYQRSNGGERGGGR